MKKIFLVFCISFIMFGCQDSTINSYNKISTEHQELNTQAFDALSKGIDLFNKQDYANSIIEADKCTKLYTQVRDLSNQAKLLAQKMKNKAWLVQFKTLSIESEEIRLDQCELINKVSTYSMAKKNTEAQETINQISDLNLKFNKLQATMDDIKNQHPEAFK